MRSRDIRSIARQMDCECVLRLCQFRYLLSHRMSARSSCETCASGERCRTCPLRDSISFIAGEYLRYRLERRARTANKDTARERARESDVPRETHDLILLYHDVPNCAMISVPRTYTFFGYVFRKRVKHASLSHTHSLFLSNRSVRSSVLKLCQRDSERPRTRTALLRESIDHETHRINFI